MNEPTMKEFSVVVDQRDTYKAERDFLRGQLRFAKLSETNKLRTEECFFPIEAWSPTDWATAMAGECGEACNYIKKMRRMDSTWNNTDELRKVMINCIGKELADLIIYADLLAQRLGLNLDECVRDKFNEKSKELGSKHYL